LRHIFFFIPKIMTEPGSMPPTKREYMLEWKAIFDSFDEDCSNAAPIFYQMPRTWSTLRRNVRRAICLLRDQDDEPAVDDLWHDLQDMCVITAQPYPENRDYPQYPALLEEAMQRRDARWHERQARSVGADVGASVDEINERRRQVARERQVQMSRQRKREREAEQRREAERSRAEALELMRRFERIDDELRMQQEQRERDERHEARMQQEQRERDERHEARMQQEQRERDERHEERARILAGMEERWRRELTSSRQVSFWAELLSAEAEVEDAIIAEAWHRSVELEWQMLRELRSVVGADMTLGERKRVVEIVRAMARRWGGGEG